VQNRDDLADHDGSETKIVAITIPGIEKMTGSHGPTASRRTSRIAVDEDEREPDDDRGDGERMSISASGSPAAGSWCAPQ